MATIELETVNACLAIMGEAKLNSLVEEHTFKQNALDLLESNDKSLQAEGWWFNTEKLTLRVDPTDSRMYLPADAATVRPRLESLRGRFMQRGRVMYDMQEGTDRFDAAFILYADLVRLIPLDDTPISYSEYVKYKTVLDFQQDFDGDQTKTRNLTIKVYGAPGIPGLRGNAEAEHIRSVAANLIDNSDRLWRIRRVMNAQRFPRTL